MLARLQLVHVHLEAETFLVEALALSLHLFVLLHQVVLDLGRLPIRLIALLLSTTGRCDEDSKPYEKGHNEPRISQPLPSMIRPLGYYGVRTRRV